jgi:hypothetical protein
MHALPSRSSRGAPRAGLHELRNLRLRRLKRGSETEQNAREDSETDRKEEDRHIDGDHQFVRKRVFRQPPHQYRQQSI